MPAARSNMEALRELMARLEAVIRVPQADADETLWIWVENLMAMVALLLDFHESTQQWMEELMVDIRLIKSATQNTSHGEATTKIKISDLKLFKGTRSAKDLKNFLWDMEQYFKATRVPEGKKVSITSMYLSKDAKLWWRT